MVQPLRALLLFFFAFLISVEARAADQEEKTSPRIGLLASGLVALGGGYVSSVALRYAVKEPGTDRMFEPLVIPVVGPFITTGRLLQEKGDLAGIGVAVFGPPSVLLGLAQVGGLVMTVCAFAIPERAPARSAALQFTGNGVMGTF